MFGRINKAALIYITHKNPTTIDVSRSVTGGTFYGSGSGISHLDLGQATNAGQVAIARGGTGVATGLTVLDPANLSSEVLIAKGGTGLTSISENDLSAYNLRTSSIHESLIQVVGIYC